MFSESSRPSFTTKVRHARRVGAVSRGWIEVELAPVAPELPANEVRKPALFVVSERVELVVARSSLDEVSKDPHARVDRHFEDLPE